MKEFCRILIPWTSASSMSSYRSCFHFPSSSRNLRAHDTTDEQFCKNRQNLLKKEPLSHYNYPSMTSTCSWKDHCNLLVFGCRTGASCSTLPESLSLMDRFLVLFPPFARSAYISVVTDTRLPTCGPPTPPTLLAILRNSQPKQVLQLWFLFSSITLLPLHVSCSF